MKTNWPVKKLGEVCEVVSGGTPDTNNSSYWKGDILWATPKDLGSLKTIEIFETERKITKEGLKNSSAKLLPTGSVLLTTRAPIGHIAIATKPIATNQGFKSFICGKKIYNKYLYYVLKNFVKDLQWLGRGATFTEISKRIVENFEIPLPGIEEQKIIVKKLEEILVKIEDTKKFRTEAQETTQNLLSSMLHKIFEEGKKKGWEEVVFGSEKHLKIIDGDRGKNYPKKSDFANNGYCLFLNTSNVRHGSFNLTKCDFLSKEKDDVLRKGKLKRGDVVLTTRGTIGNSAYYDQAVPYNNLRINSGMVILRVVPEKITQRFLLYILNSPAVISAFEATNSGSAQPQLPIRTLSKIDFILPYLSEQEKIVAYLDGLSEKVQALQKLQQEQLQDLEALQHSVLHQAFQGKL